MNREREIVYLGCILRRDIERTVSAGSSVKRALGKLLSKRSLRPVYGADPSATI